MANGDFNMAEMQRDAIRRVNQMQKKADYYVNNESPEKSENETETEKVNQSAEVQEEPKISENNNTNNTQSGANNQGGLFDSFDLSNPLGFLKNITQDKSSLIVLGLILILYREGADQILIFALIYILL